MVLEAPTLPCKMKCPPVGEARAALMCRTRAEMILSLDSGWIVKRTNSHVLVFLQPRSDLCVPP